MKADKPWITRFLKVTLQFESNEGITGKVSSSFGLILLVTACSKQIVTRFLKSNEDFLSHKYMQHLLGLKHQHCL